jgi:phage-related protein
MFTLLFGDYEFPNQTFEVKGLPLVNDINMEVIPRRHGAVIFDPYLKERYFRVEGQIHNAATSDSLTELLALQKALLAGEDNFQYSSDKYIKAYAKNLSSDFQKGTDKAVIKIAIDMVAQVPFFYSAGASYSDISDAAGVTTLFDVLSGGNAFAEPIIHFYASGATISDDIWLQNLTTGESMSWRGIVPAGQTLSIHSDTLEAFLDSVPGITNFEGDFLTLAAGTNSFQFVGEDCRITVEHKWRYYA